ncbi:lck-interacting transmembrane adapter 1 [Gastrophryne carolinensis]
MAAASAFDATAIEDSEERRRPGEGQKLEDVDWCTLLLWLLGLLHCPPINFYLASVPYWDWLCSSVDSAPSARRGTDHPDAHPSAINSNSSHNRLLRQTQLRSLSKSDTKLHEIKRPPLGDPQLRPVSMDPIYHSPNWHLHEDNATYSNLNYSPAPLKSNLYKKSAGPRGEPLNGTSESQGSEVNAEYAVVSKGRKRANPGAQERREVQAGPAEGPGLPHRPDDLEIEAMYSKVNKKKARHVESIPNVASEWAPPSLQLEENFYESICEMSSRAL